MQARCRRPADRATRPSGRAPGAGRAGSASGAVAAANGTGPVSAPSLAHACNAGQARAAPGEIQQQRHRQADHVPVVALDALDERGAAALDRVAAGALPPFAARQVPVDSRVGRASRKRHRRDAPRRCARRRRRSARARSTPRASRPGEAPRNAPASRSSPGLPNSARRARPRCRRRARASPVDAARALRSAFSTHHLARLALRQLLDVRRARPRRRCRAARGSPAAAASGREHERLRQSPSSGKKSPISRAADSAESEPCTRLNVTSSAKSPRIEPGAASSGLVAPISWRAAVDRLVSLEHHRDERAAA